MSSKGLAMLAAVLAVFLSAPAAIADKPFRFPLEGPSGQLPADVCGFPVDFVTLTGKEHGTVFSNGVFAANGALKIRITNATNPSKTLDLNISGPGRITPQADGTALLKGEGPAIFFFFPGQLAPGAPGALLFVHGLVTETLDATGSPVPGSFSVRGHVTDLCAALR